ncbi:hypothetical protein DPEC_G00269870 [Dallia pectoralis]|uniref:Uncharacterized protein n=1 Tax=Dallia pectoralis TaxID=75939 RepID=A0ACC2FP88_DALPE|nr:hypothetical protein DPEC_G00269870 [Dallia pectoralis]
MEPAEEAPNNHAELSANEPALHNPGQTTTQSKRLKELENAALQASLNSLRMETEAAPDTRSRRGQESGQEECINGMSSCDSGASLRIPDEDGPEAIDELDTNDAHEPADEERTLTDHLNKRLLSSFLDKLNQRDLALPGIQRLDCAVADEDSNRAAEEW